MSHSTRIKVSDLLLHIGQIDTVTFSWLIVPSIIWLDVEGISWKLLLQSIDNSTIIATLEDIQCHIHEESDVSWSPYVRTVRPMPFSAYFVLNPSVQTYNEDDDSPIFSIDPKNLTIDTEEMIYQCILLETPFVKRTPDEESAYIAAAPDDFDVSGEAGWQIIFRRGK